MMNYKQLFEDIRFSWIAHLPMLAVIGCGQISSSRTITGTGSTITGSASMSSTSASPPYVTYSPLNCTQSSSCSMSPTNTGGLITSAQAIGLPSGLSISSAGIVSGTPTSVSSSQAYPVTLTNSGGSTSGVTINITVFTNSFSDNTSANFSAGTLSNLTYDGSGFLRLTSGQSSGTFTSRVMNAGNFQSWNYFSWIPTLPFYKELPDSAVSESTSNYTTLVNSTLMSGNIALWHLDETSGSTIYDRSGTGNDATIQGTVSLGSVGIFGTSGSLNGSTGYLSTTNTYINPSVFTLSVWFKTTTGTGGQIIGFGDRQTGQSINYDRAVYMQNSGLLNYANNNGTNVTLTSGTAYNDGLWHQVIATQNGSAMNLYVDGRSVATQGTCNTQSYSGYWRVGYDNLFGWTNRPTSYYFSGSIDEVAVWSRALSAAEVLQVYRRGANRLKFQMRTCTVSNCSDNPTWKGYDGTNSTYFSELNNTSTYTVGGTISASLPSLLFSNFLPSFSLNSSQYFQYQTLFQSDDTNLLCTYGGLSANCSPELQSVSISH